MKKRMYSTPNIVSFEQEELTDLIMANACSIFACHCHTGTNNTGFYIQ